MKRFEERDRGKGPGEGGQGRPHRLLRPVRAGPDRDRLSRGRFYSRVKVEDVPEIVSEHLLKGRIVTAPAVPGDRGRDDTIKSLNDTDFYKKQQPHRPAQLRRHQPGEHRRVHRLGRLRGPGQGPHRDDPRGGHRHRSWTPACAAAAARASPPGSKWQFAAQHRGRPEIRLLQRRRGRPRRLHGPLRAGGRPPRRAGGHGHRRLRHRRLPGLHLRPRRVPHRRQAPADRHRAGPRVRPAGQEHLRHRL